MLDKITDLLKNNIVIPKALLINYKKLELTELEFVVLLYLINEDKNFNPKTVSQNIEIPLKELLRMIDSLSTKGFLEIKTVQSNNIRDEYIEFDNLYKKLALIITDTKDQKKENNLYNTFEKEFGRTLSPMEFEIINAWLDDKFKEETILLALKEATYNGVSNLRYIDKIIHEWRKKGITTKEDILKDRQNYKKSKTDKLILEEYDWLNNE